MIPQRIQLQRTKGWRKPEGAIVVARPSKFGNPFKVGTGRVQTAEHAVDLFRQLVELTNASEWIRDELGGYDLACWCPLDQPCHADVLLELANP